MPVDAAPARRIADLGELAIELGVAQLGRHVRNGLGLAEDALVGNALGRDRGLGGRCSGARALCRRCR